MTENRAAPLQRMFVVGLRAASHRSPPARSRTWRRPSGHHVTAAVDETPREMVADNVREYADVTAQIWDESTGAG